MLTQSWSLFLLFSWILFFLFLYAVCPPPEDFRWNQGQTRGFLMASLVTRTGILRVAASGAGAEVEFDPEILWLGVSSGLHLEDDGVVLSCWKWSF
jgi:hypothetical protein